MSRSILGHISRRSVHAILVLAVLGTVLFFAATRTQVGRDIMARELELRFEEQTGARLTIERLSGNIRQDLFATGVEANTIHGTRLFHIDSLVIRPRWSALLQREFSAYEISLFRPEINLGYLADSLEGGMGQFTAGSGADTTEGAGWRFKNASIKIHDGSLKDVSLPSGRGRVDVTSVGLHAILASNEGSGQLDILDVTASMPSHDLEIRGASAQIVTRAEMWSLNQMKIRTAASEWHLRGSMAVGGGQQPWYDRPFQLEIEPSDVNFDEIRSLLPELPLHNAGRLAAYVSGPFSELTVPWIRLGHGDSRMVLEGTAVGFPNTMEVELSLTDARLYPEDLRALIPSSKSLNSLQAAISDLQVYASGTVTPVTDQDGAFVSARLDTRSTFDVASDAGLVSGTLSLTGSTRDTLNHALSIRLEQVNAYPWTGRARWQTLADGYITVEGAYRNSAAFESLVKARLSNVRWGQRNADSLLVDMALLPQRAEGNLTVFSGAGRLNNTFSLSQRSGEQYLLESYSEADDLDIGPLLGFPEIGSRINGVLDGSTHLRWDRAFEARFNAQVDSSQLVVNGLETAVPPHSMTLVVTPPSPGIPVLSLVSDVADVQIDSPVSVPTLAALSRAWLAAFKTALDQERRKRLREPLEEASDPEATLDTWLTADAARARFPTDVSTARSHIQARLHSGTMLSSLFPWLPDMAGSAELNVDLDWTADSLRAAFSGSSSSFDYGAAAFSSPSLHGQISAVRGQSVLGSLESRISAVADTITIGGSSFKTNGVEIALSEGTGSVTLSSVGTQRLGSVQMEADWQRLEDRNLVRWTAFKVDTDDGSWLLEQPAEIGLYGDGLSLDELRIEYLSNGVSTGQSISAAGVFSGSASDSLRVGFDDLDLLPLSEFMEWRQSLGGLVNADLVLAGGYRQPRITGGVTVDTLSLDHYILGNASLRSTFVASRPDLSVEVHLDPVVPNPRAVLFGTAKPATVLQNQLSIAGNLRLPGTDRDSAGKLDLEAIIDQADVFWLSYLFPEVLGSVSGYLSGQGRVTGTFAYPVFEARLGIVDGRFTVPYTQMAYAASGSLRLDKEAIHFEPLRLTDNTGGRLDVEGRLLFNDYTSFTFDMEGSLDEFQIMNVAESDDLPFYGFIWASGNIALTGPLFNARIVSTNGRTTPNSELFIPIVEDTRDTDQAFVIFEQTPGVIPDFRQLESRSSILQKRPTSERQFLDGLNLDLNIDAPPGSIVHLVIDPLLGDVINAVSTGNIQLVLENDEFQVFGRLDVTSGDYQFTAGELFIKTFLIKPGGFIEWSGDPINATLDIPASYRTRASRAGLPGAEGERPGVIPLIVDLEIGGTVESPDVELTLSIDRSNQNVIGEYQALEALLNQPDRATEYATSVLILNSFQLTTESISTDSGGQLAFNSVSQLVTAQLNRFLASALPNVDVSFGLQGESAQDLDVTYGVALRLLNERLIIRGEGVYQGARSTESVRTSDGLQGEFVVEVRIGPHVSLEIFFRRESDILESTQLSNTAGVGLSYQTEFESWRSILRSNRSVRDRQSAR